MYEHIPFLSRQCTFVTLLSVVFRGLDEFLTCDEKNWEYLLGVSVGDAHLCPYLLDSLQSELAPCFLPTKGGGN